MKSTLFLVLIFANFQVYAQDPAGDSILCLPHWKKGETRVYTIGRFTETSTQGKAPEKSSLIYEAHITVLDSAASGYTMQWIFQLQPEFKAKNPRLADSMQVYNGLKMVYTIDGAGRFTGLINWQEVLAAYTKMFEQTLPANMDSLQKAMLLRTKGMFNSKEAVENSSIKEIQFFHTVYGVPFTSKGVELFTHISTIFFSDPLPAIQKYTYVPAKDGEDFYTLLIKQEIDPNGLVKAIDSMLSKTNKLDEKSSEKMKMIMSSLQINDFNEYHYLPDSGWPLKARSIRIIKNDALEKRETLQIQTKRK